MLEWAKHKTSCENSIRFWAVKIILVTFVITLFKFLRLVWRGHENINHELSETKCGCSRSRRRQLRGAAGSGRRLLWSILSGSGRCRHLRLKLRRRRQLSTGRTLSPGFDSSSHSRTLQWQRWVLPWLQRELQRVLLANRRQSRRRAGPGGTNRIGSIDLCEDAPTGSKCKGTNHYRDLRDLMVSIKQLDKASLKQYVLGQLARSILPKVVLTRAGRSAMHRILHGSEGIIFQIPKARRAAAPRGLWKIILADTP